MAVAGETPCGASAMVCHSDGVPGLAGPCRRGFGPGVPGATAPGGSCTWYGIVAGHHEAEPFAGLRRDEHRVGELDLLLLEFGDLRRSWASVAWQLLHLGALPEVGPHRAGDRQGQHAHHGGEDRCPPRRRAEPLLGLLLGRLRDGLPDRVGAVVRRLGRRCRPRLGRARFAARRRRAARPAPAAGYRPSPGREAGDRRLGSGRFASGTGYLASTENRGNARSPA